MYTQYIVTANYKLVDAKEVGFFKALNDLVNKASCESEDTDNDYIDVKELCTRLCIAQQTVYNRNRSGVWTEGIHFIKPSGGKLLYKWAAIKEWLKQNAQPLTTKRNPSPVQPSVDNSQSKSHTTATPSSCAPNKEFVNI